MPSRIPGSWFEKAAEIRREQGLEDQATQDQRDAAVRHRQQEEVQAIAASEELLVVARSVTELALARNVPFDLRLTGKTYGFEKFLRASSVRSKVTNHGLIRAGWALSRSEHVPSGGGGDSPRDFLHAEKFDNSFCVCAGGIMLVDSGDLYPYNGDAKDYGAIDLDVDFTSHNRPPLTAQELSRLSMPLPDGTPAVEQCFIDFLVKHPELG